MADTFILSAKLEVVGTAQFQSQFDAAARSVQQATQRMEQAGQGVAGAGSQMEAASKKAGLLERAIGKVADTALRLATFALLHGAVQAVGGLADAFIGLDQQITNALSIQDGRADKFEGQMRQVARTLSTELGIPVKEVGEGFYFLASAGLNAQQQLEALPQSAKFAKAGMFDLGAATEYLTQVFAIFKDKDPEATFKGISDTLVQAANDSQGTIEQFSAALTNKAGTAAVLFGQSMKDTVAVLEAFAQRGIQGKTAGEQYAIVLRDLAIKASKNADEFKRMGIEVFDSNGKMRPILDIIPQLQQKLGALSAEQRTAELTALGFTLRSQNVISTLLAMGDSAQVFRDKLSNMGDATDKVVQVQLSSLQAKLDILKAKTIDIGITGVEKLFEFGTWLSNTFKPAIEALGPSVGPFVDGLRQVIEPLAFITGAAIVGGIKGIALALEAVGNFAAQHQRAVELLGIAIAGIAAAHVLAGIQSLVFQFGTPLVTAISGAIGMVREFITRIAAINATEGALSAVKEGWRSIGDTIRAHPVAAVGVFIAALGALASEVKKEQREAEGMAKALISAFDTTTIAGMQAASAELTTQSGKLREASGEARGFRDFLKTTADVIPGIDFKNTSADLKGASQEAEKLARQILESKTALETLSSFSGGGKGPFGPLTEDAQKMVDKIQAIAQQSGLATGAVKLTADQLADLAAKNNIDLTGPWEKWVPELAKAATQAQEVNARAQILGPTIDNLSGAMETLSDDTKSAAEQMDALGEIIDSIIGRSLGAFEAETKLQESFQKISGVLKEFGPNLDSTTKSGREVRDALAEAARTALDYAAATSGSAGEYAQKLGEVREALIGVISQQVGSRKEAEKIVDTLGLTPKNIDTVVHVAAENLDSVTEALAGIERQKRIAEIKAEADTSLAEAQLHAVIAQERVARLRAEADVAEAKGELDTAAKLRTAAIRAEADWQNAERELNNAARERNSPVEAIPDAATAEQVLNNASRLRESLIQGNVYNGTDVDLYMAYLSRLRQSLVQGNVTNYAQIDAILAELTRARSMLIDVWYRAANQPNPNGTANLASAAHGGIFEFYARGGMRREDHVAQFAPAGAWRVWAEPETGGEAYIPMAMSKRMRSMRILEEVARRFGMGVYQYADGGRYGQYMTMPSARGWGDTVVNIAPGAVAVKVDAMVGANPEHLAGLVSAQLGPALDDFAADLATRVQRRGRI